MDIRVLRYFLAVAHEKNITRAAESLHIAQPSLSKQLMDLEKELGKTLLVRGKRQITLTDDGLLLRKRAEEIVGLLEKMLIYGKEATTQIENSVPYYSVSKWSSNTKMLLLHFHAP